MCRKIAISIALMAIASPAAMAEEAPYSQTLGEQLERVEEGKPAIPMVAAGPSDPVELPPAKSFVQKPKSTTDWPAEAAPSAGIPAAVAAPISHVPTDPRTGELIESEGGDAIPALPLEIKQNGEIQFVTGGVGDEEQAQLNAIAHDYNLQLLMAAKTGEYLSGLTVKLFDSTHKVELASVDNAGPFFYARVKPGTYIIELTPWKGTAQMVTLKIAATGINKSIVKLGE